MNLPSKELLSEVLGHYAKPTFINGDLLVYTRKEYKDTGQTINLYELAHKCIEWCLKQKNIDTVDIEYDDGEITIELGGEKNYEGGQSLYVDSDKTIHMTQVIFKACEWVLNNEKSI